MLDDIEAVEFVSNVPASNAPRLTEEMARNIGQYLYFEPWTAEDSENKMVKLNDWMRFIPKKWFVAGFESSSGIKTVIGEERGIIKAEEGEQRLVIRSIIIRVDDQGKGVKQLVFDKTLEDHMTTHRSSDGQHLAIGFARRSPVTIHDGPMTMFGYHDQFESISLIKLDTLEVVADIKLPDGMTGDNLTFVIVGRLLIVKDFCGQGDQRSVKMFATRLNQDPGRWSQLLEKDDGAGMIYQPQFKNYGIFVSDDQILRLNLDKINFDSDVQDESIIDGKLEAKLEGQGMINISPIDGYLLLHRLHESSWHHKLIDVKSMKVVCESTYDLTSIKDAQGDACPMHFEFKHGDWPTKLVVCWPRSNHYLAVTLIKGQPVVGHGQAPKEIDFDELDGGFSKAVPSKGKMIKIVPATLPNINN